MPSETDISVLIPAYNEEEYIADCVRSVASQSISATVEIVVCDDCSTDETPAILNRLQGEVDRLRLLRNDENRGIIGTRNRLLEAAKGEFFVQIDADSTMEPGTLSAIDASLSSGNHLVFCRVDVKNTRYLHPAATKVAKLHGRGTWYGGACFASIINMFVESGKFDEEMIGAEVQELKQRAEAKGWDVAYLDDVGVESNFPTAVLPIFWRKFDSARSHVRQYEHTPKQFDLWEIRGPAFWTSVTALAICSLIYPPLLSLVLMLFAVPLVQYSRDAPLAASVSGRRSFLVLYPAYQIAGGLARTVGIWTTTGTTIRIVSQKYL